MKRHVNRFLCLAAMLLASRVALATDCTFAQPKAPAGKVQALAQEAAHTNPCVVVPGLTAKSVKTVWDVFLSAPKTGGKRFDTAPPDGTPTGKVLPTAEGVIFDLRAVAPEGVQRLQVTSNARQVLALAGAAPLSVAVPLSQLTPGESYDWVLLTRKNAYKGSFELPAQDEMAAVQARLASIDKANLSAPLRLLYIAAVYDDADMYNARDRALAELRSMNAQ